MVADGTADSAARSVRPPVMTNREHVEAGESSVSVAALPRSAYGAPRTLPWVPAKVSCLALNLGRGKVSSCPNADLRDDARVSAGLALLSFACRRFCSWPVHGLAVGAGGT
jgi:hypothetical protein